MGLSLSKVVGTNPISSISSSVKNGTKRAYGRVEDETKRVVVQVGTTIFGKPDDGYSQSNEQYGAQSSAEEMSVYEDDKPNKKKVSGKSSLRIPITKSASVGLNTGA